MVQSFISNFGQTPFGESRLCFSVDFHSCGYRLCTHTASQDFPVSNADRTWTFPPRKDLEKNVLKQKRLHWSVHTWPAFFYPLTFLFPHLFLPKPLCFLHLLSLNILQNSCTIPKDSSPASHSVSQDNGPVAVPRQPWEGPREIVCSLGVLNLGSIVPLCPSAPPGLVGMGC